LSTIAPRRRLPIRSPCARVSSSQSAPPHPCFSFRRFRFLPKRAASCRFFSSRATLRRHHPVSFLLSHVLPRSTVVLRSRRRPGAVRAVIFVLRAGVLRQLLVCWSDFEKVFVFPVSISHPGLDSFWRRYSCKQVRRLALGSACRWMVVDLEFSLPVPQSSFAAQHRLCPRLDFRCLGFCLRVKDYTRC
jgi:hypothetical protein